MIRDRDSKHCDKVKSNGIEVEDRERESERERENDRMREGGDKLYLAPAMFEAYGTVAAIRLSDQYLVLSPVLERGRVALITSGHAEVVKTASI